MGLAALEQIDLVADVGVKSLGFWLIGGFDVVHALLPDVPGIACGEAGVAQGANHGRQIVKRSKQIALDVRVNRRLGDASDFKFEGRDSTIPALVHHVHAEIRTGIDFLKRLFDDAGVELFKHRVGIFGNAHELAELRQQDVRGFTEVPGRIQVIHKEFVEGQGMFTGELVLQTQTDAGISFGVVESLAQFGAVGIGTDAASNAGLGQQGGNAPIVHAILVENIPLHGTGGQGSEGRFEVPVVLAVIA